MTTTTELDVQAFLAHLAPGYDPVYAHEYYLRTRKLKGRRPGLGKPPSGFVRTVTSKAGKPPVKKPKVHPKSAPPKSVAELQRIAAVRVAQLQVKIRTLEAKLRELVAREKATRTRRISAHKKTQHRSSSAASKAKAHQHYLVSRAAGHHKKAANLNKNLKGQIAHVQHLIHQIHEQIAAVIAKVRAEVNAALKRHP
jgi:hypothetical protein